MITYLQKYNQLPRELRAKVSAPEVLSAITELEKTHNVSLASVVMRVMVRDVALLDLNKYFVFEYNLDGRHAEQLVEELKTRVFAGVSDYLGFAAGESAAAAGGELDRWAKERASAAAVRSSNFFFSPEDEEEVRSLTKTLEETDKRPDTATAEDLEARAEKIIKEAKINLSSEDLKNRLKSVLKTYLRGTRNKIDTKLALMRPINSGGMGWEENIVDSFVLLADKIKSAIPAPAEIKPPLKMRLPEDAVQTKEIAVKPGGSPGSIQASGEKNIGLAISAGTRDPAYDFSKLVRPATPIVPRPPVAPAALPPAIDLKKEGDLLKTEAGKEGEKDSVIDLKMQAQAISPAAGVTVPERGAGSITDFSQNNFSINIASAPAKKAEPQPAAAPGRISVAQARKETSSIPAGKVVMEDIKHVPKTKLTGPIDELREMNLADFRRLSADPVTAAASIKGKIKLLEDDSYSQRLSGIKAWRESFINKLYLEIGQESIVKHNSIEAVIAERKNAGAEYLSNEEFNAIMDLNKDLRF